MNRRQNENDKKIDAEPESSSGIPKTPAHIPDLQMWVDKLRHSGKTMQTISSGVAAVASLLVGVGIMYNQFMWDKNIRTWDKTDGIILIYEPDQVRDGDFFTSGARVKYKYTCKERQYNGTRIVYDSNSFPALKVGTHCQVIVNPANPQDSAVMVPDRGYKGLFERYWLCGISYIASLVLLLNFLFILLRKKAIVPERLKKYLATISPERFYAALNMEKPTNFMICVIKMREPMEYRQEQRYGIIWNKNRSCYWVFLFLPVAIIASVIVSQLIPSLALILISFLGLIAVIGIIICVLYFLFGPRMMVFDFQDKKFFCCRRFAPESFGEIKPSCSFSDVDHLRCAFISMGKNAKYAKYESEFFCLAAIRHDGTNMAICKVSKKDISLLFDLLPELAEKMGNLPITYGERRND